MKVGGGDNLQHHRLSMLLDRCRCHAVVIVHYLRSAHHCWFKPPSLPDFEPTQPNQQWWAVHISVDFQRVVITIFTASSWYQPTVLRKPTLPVHDTCRQCSVEQHCRFITQAGSVLSNNTASSSHKPAVLFLWSLIVRGSNQHCWVSYLSRLCCVYHHCRFFGEPAVISFSHFVIL
jgi:hypothetical protein